MTDSTEKDAAAKLLAEAEANDAQAAEERALAAALLADGIAPPVAVDPPAPDPVKPPPGPAAPPPGTVSPPDPKSPPQDPPAAPPSAPAPGPATPAAPPASGPPAAAGEVATMETALGVHLGLKLTAAAAAVMQIFAPGSGGGLSAAMGETGAQDDIGLYTGDTMRMIASGLDPNAVASVYSTADNSAAWPIHMADKTTGDMPAKPWLNAKQSTQDDSSNLVADPQPNPNNLRPDLAHEPHFIAGAAQLAMRRGDAERFARYVQESRCWLAWNFFSDPVQTRGPTGGEGIFMPEASINQPRGAAWGPAALYQHYLLMCDAKALGVSFVDDGWFAWCQKAVEANIDFIEREYHLGTYDRSYAVPYYAFPMGWAKNPDGIMQFPMDVLSNGSIGYGKGVDGKTVVIGAFMQAFQSWVALWLVRISPRLTLSDTARAQLASLKPWLARWPVSMFGDVADPTAWPWPYAGMYTITVGTWNADGSVAWAQNGGERFALPGNRPRPTGTAFLNDYNLGDASAPTVMDGFGYGYVANAHPAHVEAMNQGAEGSTASWARLTSSDQWKAAQDFGPPFATMLDGEMFPGASTGGDPVTTDPVEPTGPVLVPFDPKSGTLIASEVSPPGMTKYTPTVDGVGYWGAGALFFAIPLKAGVVVALDYTVLGDPAPGIAKALYLPGTVAATPPASGPVAGPTPTEPDPDPPVVEPTAGAVADYGSAGYTTEETGDDHIPLPGPIVDPSTWVPKPGQAIPMPMKGTLRDAAPSWFKDIANFALDIWTGGGWLKALEAAWTMAGGHATVEADFAALLFPKCLAWQVRNRPNQQITLADSIAGKYQGPDDIGSFDEPEAMHPYTGTIVRDGDLDVGPEAVVYATRFNPVGVTNDIFMMNPKMLTGGGWALYAKGRGIPIGNYATAAVSRKRKGFFIGDSRDGRMFFCPFNPLLPWFEVGSVIPEWGNGRLIVDESRDNGLLIGVNGSVDPYFDPTGANPNHATQLNVALSVRDLMNDALDAPVTTLAVDVSKDPLLFFGPDGVTPNFEPDRYGIDYAPGSGFIGVKRTSKGGRYIRIRWNDPKNWRAGVTPETLDVGADVGTPINDVYGSLWLRQFFLKQGDPRFYAIHPTTADDAPWCLGLEVIEQ